VPDAVNIMRSAGPLWSAPRKVASNAPSAVTSKFNPTISALSSRSSRAVNASAAAAEGAVCALGVPVSTASASVITRQGQDGIEAGFMLESVHQARAGIADVGDRLLPA
jgi:hypothetical protein